MQNSVISTWKTSHYGSQPSSVVLACKTATFSLEYQSLWVPDLTCRFVIAKQRDLHKKKSLYGFQLSPVVLCIQNSSFRTRITSLCRWIDPTCGFCMQNSDFWTRITSLYGFQTSPVIFSLQNSMPSIRITSLHGSQPSCVVFGFKTATYGPE